MTNYFLLHDCRGTFICASILEKSQNPSTGPSLICNKTSDNNPFEPGMV